MSQFPVKPYDFEAQKARGIAGEHRLDAYFAEWFHITEATDQQQRQGIDRIFWDKKSAELTLVEFKTDARANQTQHAFIEIETNGKGEGSGWAFTSAAAVLVYYIPGAGAEIAYWIRFNLLRRSLRDWLQRCRRVSVPNRTYNTVGLLVPLSEIERIADNAYSV